MEDIKHMPDFGKLLMNCPAGQTRRCQLIVNAIAGGDWEQAAIYARNAANEGDGPEYHHWAEAMRKGAEFCAIRAANAASK